MISRPVRKRLQDLVHTSRIAGRVSDEECASLCASLDLTETSEEEMKVLHGALDYYIVEYEGLVPEPKMAMMRALREKLRATWVALGVAKQ